MPDWHQKTPQEPPLTPRTKIYVTVDYGNGAFNEGLYYTKADAKRAIDAFID